MQKNQPGPDDHAAPAKPDSLFTQLVRLVTRVAIQVAQLLRDVRHTVVHQVMVQSSHLARHYDVRVYLALEPTTLVATKESRLIVRINSGPPHPASQHVIPARQAKRVEVTLSSLECGFNFFTRAGLERLIGIDLQHPFVAALRRGPVLLAG